MASSCFEKGREHADKSGGVKEGCPMSDFDLKPLHKNYSEFFREIYLIFPDIFACVYPSENKLDLVLRQHQFTLKLSYPKINVSNQKCVTFFLIHVGILFKPSQIVTKEKPQKSQSDPPNSANNDVKGYKRTWL